MELRKRGRLERREKGIKSRVLIGGYWFMESGSIPGQGLGVQLGLVCSSLTESVEGAQ